MAQVVGKLELGRELVTNLRDLNQQIEAVKDDAHARGVPPHKLRDTYGGFTLSPLLAAKAQMLHSLALINQK